MASEAGAAAAAARPMPYRYLGASGVRVSAVGLGTMNFVRANEAEAHAMIDAFVARGGNFIDTADVYSAGQSEEVVGSWLKKQTPKQRADIFVATKVHFGGKRTGPNDSGLSRMHIRSTLDESLARLQTDYVDLLQIHNYDEGTPVREWLRSLNDLITEGRIRYFGVCNVTGWQLQKIVSTAEALNLRGPVSVQNQYSLLSRHVEWEVLHCAVANGIAFLPWSPLKGGWLTGKYKKDAEVDPESRVGMVMAGRRPKLQSSPDYDMFANDKTWALLDEMRSIGVAKGATVAQVAVRWLLQRPAVQSVLIGPRTLGQMHDCLGAVDFDLAAEEVAALGRLSQPEIPYPYEMVWRASRPSPDRGRLDGNLWPFPETGLSNLP